MTNLLDVLKWRISGSYDPEGPVTEDGSVRAQNRAKYEAWKYHTFGPGRDVFCRDRDFVYQIIDSGELQGEPLHVNNPCEIAGLASIIAEMEGHKFIAMMTPVGTLKNREDVEREEDTAIDRFVCYLIPENLPPRRYTEWHDDPHEKLGWINYYAHKRYPMERVIARDAQKIRENYRRTFKEMLETLKCKNNP
ncbi:hypothetical protein HYX14_06465 [Candidatus Woesearchaeota archaeon]|nr:hypothetical protein [Candidatus Woesearchaeota archaeon]